MSRKRKYRVKLRKFGIKGCCFGLLKVMKMM